MTDNGGDDRGGDAEVRGEVAAIAKRDELGFITSSQPNLSLPQVKFILAVGATGDSVQAAEAIGLSMADVVAWMDDDEFRAAFHTFLSNKREGVKQIGAQILPTMLLELTQILTKGNNKEKLTAAKLLAQLQGLIITQNTTVDKGALEALREELMRPRPAQSYRTLHAPQNTTSST